MRTAADFNAFYASPDPWRIADSTFRDRVMLKRMRKYVSGKSVLELGCGEGHLTQTAYHSAQAVTGVDISDKAIARARALSLSNANFKVADFLELSFEGYDVITAIECVYYLSPQEQEEFFAKVTREHPGKPLLVSGPIIGQNEHRRYFTHAGILETFRRHRFTVIEHRNLYTRRIGPLSTLAAAIVRLPGCMWLLDLLPNRFVYQRLYAIKTA